jgi:hypothetical protein
VASPAAAYQLGEPRPPLEYDTVDDMRYSYELWHPNAFISTAQRALAEKGYYSGPIDGYASPAYSAAIWNFQKAQGLPRTAQLDGATAVALASPTFGYYASPPLEPATKK